MSGDDARDSWINRLPKSVRKQIVVVVAVVTVGGIAVVWIQLLPYSISIKNNDTAVGALSELQADWEKFLQESREDLDQAKNQLQQSSETATQTATITDQQIENLKNRLEQTRTTSTVPTSTTN